MDLISYIKNNAIASSDKYLSVKNRLKSILGQREPDMDLSDNSVVGDLILNRFANIVALTEEGQACMLSDIQLSNIINGNICDCAFAEAFVKSLGIDSLLTAKTTGVIRIKFKARQEGDGIISENDSKAYNEDGSLISTLLDTYTTDGILTLDSGTSLGFPEDMMFHFYAPKPGPIYIKFPKRRIDFTTVDFEEGKNKNFYYAGIDEADTIVDVVDGTVVPRAFFVDIPIYGPSNANIPSGTEAETDLNPALLKTFITEIATASDIVPYETPTSLVELAKLAQKLYPSSNFSTKGGIISYFAKQFPQMNCVVPVTNVDTELLTNETNTNPFLDIYTKTGGSYVEVTQIIPEGFAGFVSLMAPPDQITSCFFNTLIKEDEEIKLGEQEQQASILDKPSNKSNEYWLDSTCLFSQSGLTPKDFLAYKNKFLLLNIFNGSEPLIIAGDDSTEADYGENRVAYIKLTYRYDPAIMFATATVESPACAPLIPTTCNQFVNCNLQYFNVNYNKKSGAYVDRQQAQASINMLLNNICYPLKYDDSYITNIMVNNGALSVPNIECRGVLQVSPCMSYINNANSTFGLINNGNKITDITNIEGYITIGGDDDTATGDDDTATAPKYHFNYKNTANTINLYSINLIETTTTI